jgi:hypothetical protein
MRIQHLLITLALATAATVHAAENLPYGHPDFLPTPSRPIGFGGDGNSYYPGASPVYEFWEGRPKPVTVEVPQLRNPGQPSKTVESWDVNDRQTR